MKKLLLVLALASAAFAGAPSRLVVHEWGTFTSIAGKDGFALEYRPLEGTSDLPSFVYTFADPNGIRRPGFSGKVAMAGTVRMETPVLYFYADETTRVSAKVGFPGGKITEFYPAARELTDGIDWGTFTVKPPERDMRNGTATPPGGTEPSHYYKARETDADMLRVCNGDEFEYEKFLFYRGVGTFDLPVRVTLEGPIVRVSGDLGADAVVFENKGGKKRFGVVRAATGSEAAVSLGELHEGDVAEELVRILRDAGLYEKEARAMLATWNDSWFEEGLRVFYLLPRKATDAVLPLTITPAPTELVRVLVGRAEVITPELEADVREQAERLGDARVSVREAAQKALAKHGRFARPILEEVAKHSADPELRLRVRAILAR